jgi:peptide/nickel transport system substrate-binding protein
MSRMSGRPPMVAREIDGLLAEWASGRLSRRSVIRRAAALGLSVLLRAAQEDPASGTKGGTLNVVILGDPPHLDEHQSTAGVIANVSYCMYETLFAYDADWQPIPQLVETNTISEDGLVHTMA